MPSSQCQGLLSGSLDHEKLKHAFREVTAVHEILRTTFHNAAEPAMYVQVVHEPTRLSVKIEESAASLEVIRKQAAERGYESIRKGDELLDLRACAITADRWLLTISAHAAICDGVGLRNVLCDLSDAYDSSLEIDEEILQYADVAEWANDLFEGEQAEAGLEYWIRESAELVLSGLPFCSYHGARKTVSVQLPSNSTLQLSSATEEIGLNLESVFVSCGSILLRALIDQPHVSVGLVRDGRTLEELRELPGSFRKILPLGIDVELTESVGELTKSVHRQLSLHSDYQEYFDWGRVGA